MKKSLVAGAAAFAMAALPVAGVFAADPAPITDTLTVQIGEACTFQRAANAGDGAYTKSLDLGQLDAEFASSGFKVVCNNATGYNVAAVFTALAGPGENITYSQTTPTAGSGTWTASVGADNLAATGASLLSNDGVTSTSGDTATVNYKVSVRNNQGKGTYTGTATYTLTQNPAS